MNLEHFQTVMVWCRPTNLDSSNLFAPVASAAINYFISVEKQRVTVDFDALNTGLEVTFDSNYIGEYWLNIISTKSYADSNAYIYLNGALKHSSVVSIEYADIFEVNLGIYKDQNNADGFLAEIKIQNYIGDPITNGIYDSSCASCTSTGFVLPLYSRDCYKDFSY